MGNSSDAENNVTTSEVPSWDYRDRAYSAMHHRSGRIVHLCFIPNTGTHDRYLPLADLRLVDPAKDGTELILEFSAVSVIITGRFLRRLADDIAISRCAALEAFDGHRRDMPDDPTAPFIDCIRFFVPQQEETREPVPSKQAFAAGNLIAV